MRQNTINGAKTQKQLQILYICISVYTCIISLLVILQVSTDVNPFLKNTKLNSKTFCKKCYLGTCSGCEIQMYPF